MQKSMKGFKLGVIALGLVVFSACGSAESEIIQEPVGVPVEVPQPDPVGNVPQVPESPQEAPTGLSETYTQEEWATVAHIERELAKITSYTLSTDEEMPRWVKEFHKQKPKDEEWNYIWFQNMREKAISNAFSKNWPLKTDVLVGTYKPTGGVENVLACFTNGQFNSQTFIVDQNIVYRLYKEAGSLKEQKYNVDGGDLIFENVFVVNPVAEDSKKWNTKMISMWRVENGTFFSVTYSLNGIESEPEDITINDGGFVTDYRQGKTNCFNPSVSR